MQLMPPTTMRNTYLFVSGACAVATVVLGVVQTFNLVSLNQTTTVEPRPAAVVETAPKSATLVVKPEEPELAEIAPADLVLGPGSRRDIPQAYRLADLFDGDPATVVRTAPSDGEIDFIVELRSGRAARLAGIEYRHPAGESAESVAAKIDVTVLPDGQLDGAGREVRSFTLAAERGTQRFRFPPARGRGLWLRIAAPDGASGLAIGDIRLLTQAPQ